MIHDLEIARHASDLMVGFLRTARRLGGHRYGKCSPEEFRAYRRAVGKVMAEMVLEIMNPLYKEHPSIKPGIWSRAKIWTFGIARHQSCR